MYKNWLRSKTARWFALTAAFLIMGEYIISSFQVQAQIEPTAGRVVNTLFPSEWRDGTLAGLAYAADLGQFLALMQQSGDQDATGAAELSAFTPFGDPLYSVAMGQGLENAAAIAFDPAHARLLLLNNDRTQVSQVGLGEQARLAASAEALLDTRPWGLHSATGMAVAQDGSALFILDGAATQVVRVGLDPASGGADVQRVELSHLAASDLRGLALHPHTGHLFVLSIENRAIYELTPAGEQVTAHDAGALPLAGPSTMLFAPSTDQTDAGDVMHLFIADGIALAPEPNPAPSDTPQGTAEDSSPQAFAPFMADPSGTEAVSSETVSSEAVSPEAASSPQSGAARQVILEITFEPPSPVYAAALAAATELTLVQTVDMSALSPPSPDPSGITYIEPMDILWIPDGEVDEIDHLYAGANLFGLTLDGALTYTATTVGWSWEPTDAAFNPHNGHIFYSDDNSWPADNHSRKIFQVDPGPDERHGTDDDIIEWFRASDFGSMDPEGLAYDPINNHLYIADGVNSEVYRIAPGANGIFDGVAANGGDDLVTQFDVQGLGIEDPEGIDYDLTSGNLVMTGRSTDLIYVLTTAGDLVATYDISTAQAVKPAGIAIAPSSADPTKMSYYIVDRGVDNNSDPTQNDGKMYEFASNTSFPTPVPTATPLPTATPTPVPTPTPKPDLIFSDSFESGDLSTWSSSVTNGGALAVSPAAALSGDQGLQATIQDNTSIYVLDDRPLAESRYRARFYFDPNSILMANGDDHSIFQAYNGSVQMTRVLLRFSGGNYQLRAGAFDDGGTWIPANWITISDAPHLLELDWGAATAPGQSNGFLKFWVDGVPMASLTQIDNDTHRIERVRLGAASGVDAGTRGVYYFDAFVSNRQSYIGPAADAPVPTRLMLPWISD